MTTHTLPFALPTRAHENFRYLPFQDVSWEKARHSAPPHVFKNQIKLGADGVEVLCEGLSLKTADAESLKADFKDLHKSTRFDVLAEWSWKSGEHFSLEIDRDLELQITVEGQLQQVPHLFIRLKKGVKLVVLESVAAASGSSNHFVSYVCEEDSQLERVLIQNSTGSASHFFYTQILVRDRVKLLNTEVSLGGHVSRHNLNVMIEGSHANCSLHGLYAPNFNQIHDHQPNVWHRLPQSTSSQFYKGLLSGNGRGNFTGRIEIDQVAQKTDSSQLNRNLILSREAEVNSKPELQVHADDVKAGHGASIGQLDPEEIFYLQSRCISYEEAVEMLSNAYGLEVADKIENEKIRHFVSSLIRSRSQKVVNP